MRESIATGSSERNTHPEERHTVERWLYPAA
jgi:hypothetical protein